MTVLQAFPPVVAPGAHTLILGSMPSAASLEAAHYYAHPRNLFWPIVGEILGFAPEAPYSDRVAVLLARGYALWDVLGSCRREGSLDSAIQADSMEINDFSTFLAVHPEINRIFFNGTFAADLFRRRVMPTLKARGETLSLIRLPSTSPANASISREAKRTAWAAIQCAR